MLAHWLQGPSPYERTIPRSLPISEAALRCRRQQRLPRPLRVRQGLARLRVTMISRQAQTRAWRFGRGSPDSPRGEHSGQGSSSFSSSSTKALSASSSGEVSTDLSEFSSSLRSPDHEGTSPCRTRSVSGGLARGDFQRDFCCGWW